MNLMPLGQRRNRNCNKTIPSHEGNTITNSAMKKYCIIIKLISHSF